MKSPDLVLDKADPGDDVAARFDYQHTYAAINAIRLITGEGDCVEIICENHEDFLLKNGAGKFIGTQITIRGPRVRGLSYACRRPKLFTIAEGLLFDRRGE